MSPLLLDIRMYIIADKYFVAPLKDLAARKFNEGAKAWWNSRAFANAAAEVYSSAAKDSFLKHSVVDVTRKHAQELLDPTKGYDAFLEVLNEVPELGKDVAIALVSYTNQDEYICPICGSLFTIHSNAELFRCPHCSGLDLVASKGAWASHLVKK